MSSPPTIDAPAAKLLRLRELRTQLATREAARLAQRRRELLEACPHPLALAQRFDQRVVSTPAMELVSTSWVRTLHTYDGRLTISVGPQQGKSQLSRWAVFWALLDDPDRRVVFASHSMSLARTSGRIIRSLVEAYGGPYGLAMDLAHHDASDWQLRGFLGGCLSASIESTLTGRPSDVMVLDDLLSGEAEANSPTIRSKVETWWESTARVRMAPGTPAVAIGTRWSEDDILSRFIAEGWSRINIPARADGETFDSLADVPTGRTPDGYLVSTRGTAPADWETIRGESGERAWAALFQGRPAPLEGGIFQRAWFEQHRVDEAPELVEIAVGVDPADTGTGDAAGVLVAGRSADRHLYLLADLSGMLTQAQWARTACIAWLRHEAARIVQERNLGMRTSIPDAWARLRRQAAALRAAEGSVYVALASLAAAGDDVSADAGQLTEVAPLVDDILSRPSSGPRVESVTVKQSKLIRAQSVTGLFETGKAHVVGRLAALEYECCTWQPGQPSPNRIDVMAMLVTRLDQAHATATVARKAKRTSVPTRTPQPRRW